MTTLSHIAARLFNEPLLVSQGYLDVALTAIHDRLDIEPIIKDMAATDYTRPGKETVIDIQRGIAIVPIVGALDHRGGSINSLSGMASYTGLQAALKEAAGTRGVRAILLDIDSPGGSVAGVTETADFIKALSKQMPIYALANSLCASAAFWLASACTRIYAAPMANIGSVGVVVAHVDQSKMMEKRGVAVTHIHAGAKKVEGNPYGPLSDGARKDVQARIDAIYGEFVSTVATNRGIDPKVVRATEAGVFGPDEALELGFIDGIGTLSDVLGALSTRLTSQSAGGLSITSETSMTERTVFAQSDLDAAVARATGDATTANATAIAAAVTTGVAASTAEIAAAANALAPGNDRLAGFFEALSEGATVSLAAKMAGRIPAPSASAAADPVREAAVAAVFAAAAPGVAASAGAGGDNVDPRAARMAALREAAKAGSAASYSNSTR